jgi:hypothetical protein
MGALVQPGTSRPGEGEGSGVKHRLAAVQCEDGMMLDETIPLLLLSKQSTKWEVPFLAPAGQTEPQIFSRVCCFSRPDKS